MPISKVQLPNNTTQDVHDSRVVSDAITYVGDAIGSATYTADGEVVDLSDYQLKLVSGTNIKTINNESLLGSGNISISGGSGGGEANVIEAITFNGTPATITNKTAAITATIPTVPTISTSITTDATSDTKTASPKAVKTYVDGIVGDIETLLAAI